MPQIAKMPFEYYFNAHYQQALGYIIRKLGDRYLAEDLAMDAFVACYQRFDSFDPARASFQTWLYVVINNRLKNHYRDRKEHDDIDEYTGFVSGFEDELLAAEQLKLLRAALADALGTLSGVQREIVVLRYFKELNSAEIGEQLGLSPVNVRVQLSRAVAKLKDYFDSNGIRWEY